ncbi:lanthionine synthetase LanC family protein [Kitasatospora aureofaciens]|uniref:lanthionine synthetase LanC family protein n=1 Tax=Kitasatospora aureofaciens TaxID=1894 RepID=UPI0038003415
MSTTDRIRTVAELLSRPGTPGRPPAPAPHQGAEHALAAGRTGTALALAVLADHEDAEGAPEAAAELRRAAHGQLAAAVKSPGGTRGGGLFSGAAALAFAARTMARRPGEYRSLLDALAPRVRQAAAARVAELRADLAAGAGLRAHTFDTVSGVAGLGRLLLALEPDGPALADLLTALVELAEPTGTTLPRWWTAGGPGLPGADPDFPQGHLNLGLAHGIPGPLALLALARLRGVGLPGQDEAIDEAIEALASWLAARQTPTGSWPMTLRVEDERAGRPPADPPTRAAWCYGTPGAARALFLAGAALRRPDWQATAVAALAGTLAADPSGWNLDGPGLCHGTAGLLRITQRTAEESGSAELAAHLPALAATVGAELDTVLAAGHPSGLLEGTAGAALALHGYTRTTTADPAAEWDAFLLIG